MSNKPGNYRELESSIHTDLERRQTYNDYLQLDKILSAQTLRSDEHDELLFIVIHQASELWLKLAGHEVEAACEHIAAHEFPRAFKVIARVRQILMQLTQSWSILATMTPVDYLTFRDTLGKASGFQSYTYRRLEFLLGNRNSDLVNVHRSSAEATERLEAALNRPSLYDETIRRMAANGFEIEDAVLDRDLTQPYESDPSVFEAWLKIYRNSDQYYEFYELGERLLDIEDAFQQWRFKHMYTVQRVIGLRSGTGGSSGVPFLRKALDISFFPELFGIRTSL